MSISAAEQRQGKQSPPWKITVRTCQRHDGVNLITCFPLAGRKADTNFQVDPAFVKGEGDGTHSSTLAWRIPWSEEPGRLQSTGLQRVRHNWSDLLRHMVSMLIWYLWTILADVTRNYAFYLYIYYKGGVLHRVNSLRSCSKDLSFYEFQK